MRFEPEVLAADPDRRIEVVAWLEAALAAVDPERLTRAALSQSPRGPVATIAIGKAASAMTRGAASAAEIVMGLCISDHAEDVPDEVTTLIGDHPIPGPASFEAGNAAIDFVRSVPSDVPILGLISGGGSAVCEYPRPGVSTSLLTEVATRLVRSGATIEEINLARGHLSSTKRGGLAARSGRVIETLVISDVAGADPSVVASGPTSPTAPDPSAARAVLARHGIEVTTAMWEAMTTNVEAPPSHITLLADGFDAAQAVAVAASDPVEIRSEWLESGVVECVDDLLSHAGPGVTVCVGEPVLEVDGPGKGGRNTHAALTIAPKLAGSTAIFVAFATDGVDGRSGSAGAIVDGATVKRGGDPRPALTRFDSAEYLARSGDLLRCRPTGTNVSDLWILWKPARVAN